MEVDSRLSEELRFRGVEWFPFSKRTFLTQNCRSFGCRHKDCREIIIVLRSLHLDAAESTSMARVTRYVTNISGLRSLPDSPRPELINGQLGERKSTGCGPGCWGNVVKTGRSVCQSLTAARVHSPGRFRDPHIRR